MGITEFIAEYATHLIDQGGYFIVLFLMTLESMIAPIPSEAVMPFAGFLIFDGKFTFTGVIFYSTLGSIIGSLISYFLGLWGGRAFVLRFGRYLLLDVHHLEATERFFRKYGDKTIFISRFVPVVRHLISIPAGIGRMNLVKFSIYTIIGAGLWNAFLTWVGYVLKENWGEVMKYSHVVDVVVVAVLGLGFLYVAWHQYKRMQKARVKG
ncbi:MAG: DedA family protein [Candidatus Zixiibacteriota bacterium]|nr:MAG: DedA family protein [candidate division Zixibacteria bacterium]